MALETRLKTYSAFVKSIEEKKKKEYLNGWKNDIQQLFRKIMYKWFDSYSDDGLAQFELIPIEKHEEKLGTYITSVLRIQFQNSNEIILDPVMGVSFGSQGRIDMYMRGFSQNRVQLRRNLDDKNKANWTIWKSTQNEILLTKENFEKLIEEWL